MEEWSAPSEVFPVVNAKGAENEPFAFINGTTYAVASDVTWNNTHDSGVRGALLMRRLLPGPLGPIFWVTSDTPPATYSNISFPLLSEMPATVYSVRFLISKMGCARALEDAVVSHTCWLSRMRLYPTPAGCRGCDCISHLLVVT